MKINGEKDKLAAKINMEADDEIAKITEPINKRRYEWLQENDEDSYRKILIIEDVKDTLNRDLEHIKQKFEQESHLQQTKYQNLSKSLDEALDESRETCE